MKFNELSQELRELWTRGVDHGKFNEEWARMGGVVKINGKEVFYAKLTCPIGDWGYFSKCVNKNGNPLFIFEAGYKEYDDETLSDYKINRMATPSECAEAGIDYIPFMGWRDIESVPYDVSVLTCTADGAGIGTYERNLRQRQWMPLPLV
jgi:hypothetical protein